MQKEFFDSIDPFATLASTSILWFHSSGGGAMQLARTARSFVTFAVLARLSSLGFIDPMWFVEIEADCVVK